MPQALVVYESMFGHARDVALAIARGLAGQASVESVEVGQAPTDLPGDVELLVVGAPNHNFGLPEAKSRAQAAELAGGPLVSATAGLREWLVAVTPPARKVSVVAFDLRLHHPAYARVDRAATQIAQRLRMKGMHAATGPEAFLVLDYTGPFAEGELERAEHWGASLAALLPRD